MNVPTIETERLLLRPISEKDSANIFSFCSSPTVSKYVIWETHQSEADTLKFIREWALPHYEKGIPDPMGICFHDEDRVIGTVGLIPVPGNAKRMEIGYALAEEYWGQGIVKEACTAMLDFVFWKWPEVSCIEARCMPQNERGLKILKKLGMTQQGEQDGRRVFVMEKDAWLKIRKDA